MTLLRTERLELTEITTEDQKFIFELLNSAGWLEFIGDREIHTLEDAEAYIKNSFIKSYENHGFGLYKMMLKNDNTPIGVCGLLKRKSQQHVDIGYAILPKYSGQGYMAEAAQIVLQFARTTMKCKKVLAFTKERNVVSQRLLEKLGFQFEGIKKLEEFDEESTVYAIQL